MNELPFNNVKPERIVSLVPSITDSIYSLGLEKSLVGITDYCIVPDNPVSPSRVGQVKDVHVQQIVELNPDLVIANKEENSKENVQQMIDAGIFVWLTFPLSVQNAIDDLWQLAKICRNNLAVEKIRALEKSLDWTRNASKFYPPFSYFCPVWQEKCEDKNFYWITFNQKTYSNDVLALFGGENVFKNRQRRFPLSAEFNLIHEENPGERDRRYPRVGIDEVLKADPEVILLPDEPFEFRNHHRQEFLELFIDTPAVKNERVYLVDGKMVNWFGTYLMNALTHFPGLFWSE